MNQIEKLRHSKKQAPWLPWLWLTVASIWIIVLLLNISAGQQGNATLAVACFATCLSAWHATAQKQVNRELLREIDLLKARIR